MTTNFIESVVEDAALAWLERLGYMVKHGPEIAPGELASARQDYGQLGLEDRLRDTALPRLISGELRVPEAVRTWERNA